MTVESYQSSLVIEWRLLAQFVLTRPAIRWLELPDGTVLLVTCSTEGHGLSQERCWEVVAALHPDQNLACLPDRPCFDSLREAVAHASTITADPRTWQKASSLEEALSELRVIQGCPL